MAKAEGINWDLSDLYEGISDPRVEKDFERISARADRFEKKYRGKIKSPSLTAGELAGAVKEVERLSEGIGKILSFSHLVFAADTRDPQKRCLSFINAAEGDGSSEKAHFLLR